MTVGDVTSTERGSGARFNEGKAPLELIPLRYIADAYGLSQSVTLAQLEAADALRALGEFQARRSSQGHFIRTAIRRLSLPDGAAWLECAQVFDYGRKKYAEWNWAKGMAWSVPIGCAARHALAILRGEHLDPESGLSHRGHFMCNLVMLQTFIETFPEGDDRMPESVFGAATK